MLRISSIRKSKNHVIKRKFIRTGEFVVYILECSDGSYYTGYTNNIVERLRLHKNGLGSKYVRSKLPVKLVYCSLYRYYKLAIKEERRIKGLSRQEKETLVCSSNAIRRHKIRKDCSYLNR